MSKNQIFSIVGSVALLLASCNLSDFQTNKLVAPTDLNPVLYMPVASGNYLVKDYTHFPELGNMPVPEPKIDFDTIRYDMTQLNFIPIAVYSMVIIVKTVNESPMRLQYSFSFTGKTVTSPLLQGAKLNANGDVIESVKDSIEYKLNYAEILNLGITPSIDMAVSLFQPASGSVIAKVLKFSSISVKVGFRAPVNLVKIKT